MVAVRWLLISSLGGKGIFSKKHAQGCWFLLSKVCPIEKGRHATFVLHQASKCHITLNQASFRLTLSVVALGRLPSDYGEWRRIVDKKSAKTRFLGLFLWKTTPDRKPVESGIGV
jgi:hypothetical protein